MMIIIVIITIGTIIELVIIITAKIIEVILAMIEVEAANNLAEDLVLSFAA